MISNLFDYPDTGTTSMPRKYVRCPYIDCHKIVRRQRLNRHLANYHNREFKRL